MAHSVQVVFRSDVRGIAQAGDVKNVSSGYARNYLFPRKLAFPASDSLLRQWETERQGTMAKAARVREAAQSLAERLEALTCSITAKASAEGKLFGSVGAPDIVAALAKEGLTIDKKDVVLPQHIKQVGPATVTVHVGAGTQASLKINVVPENG